MFSQYPLPKTINSAPAEVSDPVACCLRDSMFTCVDNPMRNVVGACSQFMSQRCATNWDGKCDLFLSQQDNSDYTGKASSEFLKQVLEAKFCRLDTSNPASHCFEKKTQYNPVAFGPGKGDFDQQEGDFVYRPNNKLLNISTNNFAYGRLDTASPIKIAKCPKTCDLNILNISNDDRALNEALDRGAAQDVIQNIAENLVSAGIKTNNQRLDNFISKFIMIPTKGMQPGFSSLGASPYLSTTNIPTPENTFLAPGRSYKLDSDIGNFGNSLAPSSAANEPFRHSRRRNRQSNKFGSNPIQENFRLLSKDKSTMAILLLIVIISYVMFVYMKY
jgi:hypothetical protein